MKSNLLLGWLLLLTWSACQEPIQTIPVDQQAKSPLKESGAGQALDFFGAARSYPLGSIPTPKFVKAFEDYQAAVLQRNDFANWESLGPDNVGGRMLDLAFHPTDTRTLFYWSTSEASANHSWN